MAATQELRTLTPPRSSHGPEYGVWDSGVGMNGQKSNFPGKSTYPTQQFEKWQPLGQSANVARKVSYGSGPSSYHAGRNGGEGVLPRRGLSRQKSNLSMDNEVDEIIDRPRMSSGSRNNSRDTGIAKRKPSKPQLGTPEEDEDNWIHRDKLAQIESRELEEAGFFVGQLSRATSRATMGGLYSRQDHRDTDSDLDDDTMQKRGYAKRQRLVSPISVEDEGDGNLESELRRPEEVARNQETQNFYVPQLAKSNGTRLPMPKQSPAPVPSSIIQRDSPLPRSRTSSINARELRPRSRSVGSRILLDDDSPTTGRDKRESSGSSEGQTNSHAKTKAPSKAAPVSGGRKASNQQRAVSGTAKPRNSSQQNRNSTEKRSSASRPSTSHRIEGDPPWLAGMYKPDPRLPPDQQMLPTHAKRLAQEKWEKEGKTGTVYDREFRLLNSEEIQRPAGLVTNDEKDQEPQPKPVSPALEPRKSEPEMRAGSVGAKLPLLSPSGSKHSSSRPDTSGTEHGGYSTMPRIVSPPVPTPSTPLAQTELQLDLTRLPEPQEDVKQKKGCCCIVM